MQMRIKDRIKQCLRDCMVWYFAGRTKRKIKKNNGDTGNILLVKQDGLGDFILFQNAIREIKRLYPNKKLYISCYEMNVVYAELTGLFDGIIPFNIPHFRLGTLIKTYRKLKDYRFDILLHPTQPRHLESEIFVSFINAKVKISSVGERGTFPPHVKEKWDRQYDIKIEQGMENMTLIQTANFLRGLGAKDYKATMPKLEIAIRDCHLCLPEKYFVVFLGASIYNKKWAPKKFYRVAEHIFKKTGWTCVLCGMHEDKEQEFEFSQQGNLPFVTYIAKTEWDEFIYVISHAQLVVGNDTSAIHFANALNVQSVCVKGQFSGNKFFPYFTELEEPNRTKPISVSCPPFKCFACTMSDQHYRCSPCYTARHRTKCIEKITTEMVVHAVDIAIDLIERRARSQELF